MASEASQFYNVLGLPNTASRLEVKEAFRKLCLQYHPDKVGTDMPRSVAEGRFRDIKSAYDNILKSQAGYGPPGPGSGPSASYTRAYYRAHGHAEPGPVRCGGPFGGYLTEMEFYRGMMRTSRNSPFALLLTGLIAIPAVAMLTSAFSGDMTFIRRFKDEGITMFTQDRLNVNGRSSTINPFMIRDLERDKHELYYYKYDKYKHLHKDDGAGGDGTPEAA